MKQKTRKILHGLSVAGLVAAGSIPVMGVDAKSSNKNAIKAKDNVAAPKKCAAKTGNKNAKAKSKSSTNTKAGQQK